MGPHRLQGQPKAHRGGVDSRMVGAPQGYGKHAGDRDTSHSHEIQRSYPQIQWEYWTCKRNWKS